MRYQGENVLVLDNNVYIDTSCVGELVEITYYLYFSDKPLVRPALKNSLPVGVKVADNTYETNKNLSSTLDYSLKGEQFKIMSIAYEGIVRLPLKSWISSQAINEGDFVGVKFFGPPDNPTIPCYVLVDTFDADKVLGIALSNVERDFLGMQYIDLLLLNPQITPLA